ncbi:MAG TPA: hypothetical protein PLW69_10960, partial [Agitococcus sp.]|nr:hypothetical protein [Agitococcus sp.]
MGKLKETSPKKLQALKNKADVQKIFGITEEQKGAAAPVGQSHDAQTGRARPKKPRTPHQKCGVD